MKAIKQRNIIFNIIKKRIKKLFKNPLSYSQYGQDIFCYNNFFKNNEGGTFVEVGADDGISKSNSYFYEQRGWNGLCVEPSPKRFKLLQQNRSCVCENYAIATEEKNVDFLEIHGYGKGLSGIIDEYDGKHTARIKDEVKHPKNQGHEVIQVTTIPLAKLLLKHNISHVHFCSIDVEGGELSVLKSIDFDACSFDVFVIENNYNDNSVEQFMNEHGFEKKKRLVIDDIYVRNTYE